MFGLYKKLENIWFKLPQKLRFLLVGGFNTVFSYGLFAFMVTLLLIPYKIALVIGYVISTNISIFTQRYYVFRSFGNLKAEYIRAWEVYILIMFINYIAMYVMVDIMGINELIAQAFYAIFSTIFTYIAHRFFSFAVKNDN